MTNLRGNVEITDFPKKFTVFLSQKITYSTNSSELKKRVYKEFSELLIIPLEVKHFSSTTLAQRESLKPEERTSSAAIAECYGHLQLYGDR